jgi:glucose/arabinose dehydrogenase/chitodextrinase
VAREGTNPARRLVAALLTAAAFASAAPASQADVSLPAGFQEQTVAESFWQPVDFAVVPGDSQGRILVLRKDGVIDLWRSNGTQKQILGLLDQVSSFHDRGLLGVALDKNFAANHYIYVVYDLENQTNPSLKDGDLPTTARLSRFTVDLITETIDPTSEVVLLGKSTDSVCSTPAPLYDCIPNDFPWHSIGTVRVDPADGTLWLGVGDGVESNTYKPQTQRTFNTDSLAGKILHVGTDGKGVPGHPFCPGESNMAKNCTKVYAKGFRNPFRFSLRPSPKGPIVGDVGEGRNEEIDLVKPGANYGWPCYEGADTNPVYSSATECQSANLGTVTGPSYTYPHDSNGGGSAAGGPLFTGSNYPSSYANSIFVFDYAQQWIRRLTVDSNDNVTQVHDFATGARLPVELQVGPDGNLWGVDIGYLNPNGGKIVKYVYTPGNQFPVAHVVATPTSGPVPLTVDVNGGTSTDADGDTLTYDWDWGDGSPHGSGVTAQHNYLTPASRTITLTVSDGRGGSDTDTVIVTPGNTAPMATIAAPTSALKYADGDTIMLQGSGSDAQDPSVALSWHVLLRHGVHYHDYGSLNGSSTSFRIGRDHDNDSYYEITLTATDSQGSTGTSTVSINPKTVNMRLASSPAGAPVVYTQTSAIAPLDRTTVPGFDTSISAAPTWTSGGRAYNFVSWSDGGAATHTVRVPSADVTLTARYNASPDAAASAAASTAPLAVDFDARASSDPDGDALTYSWDFGDGQAGTGAQAQHVYALAGEYTAKLTVSDGLGGSAVTTVTASPTNAPAPPPYSGGGTGDTGGSGTGGGDPPTVFPLVDLRLPKAGLRLTSRRALRVTLRNRNDVASIGALDLWSVAKLRTTSAKRARRVAFGDAAFIVGPGKTRTITVRLSSANRKLLAKLGKVKVRIAFDAHDRSGRHDSGSAVSMLLAPRR